jgi:hypothetical protein
MCTQLNNWRTRNKTSNGNLNSIKTWLGINIFLKDWRNPLIIFCSTSVLQLSFYNLKSFESVSMMNYLCLFKEAVTKNLLIQPSNGSLMIVIIELERYLNLNRFSSLQFIIALSMGHKTTTWMSWEWNGRLMTRPMEAPF